MDIGRGADLAVEVLSLCDTSAESAERIGEWLTAGCSAVWLINFNLRAVAIYQPTTNVQIRTPEDQLSDDRILPGFSFVVDELFQ